LLIPQTAQYRLKQIQTQGAIILSVEHDAEDFTIKWFEYGNDSPIFEGKIMELTQPELIVYAEVFSNKIPDFSIRTNYYNGGLEILYPENDMKGVPLDSNIRWTSINNASGYELFWADNPNFINGKTISTTDTFANIGELGMMFNSKYYCRVRFKRDEAWSLVTSPITFETKQVKEYIIENDSLELVRLYEKLRPEGQQGDGGLQIFYDSPAIFWPGVKTEFRIVGEEVEHWVTELNWSESKLTGTIDKINLDSLKLLNFGENNLEGDLPDFASTVLETITLYSNNFTGGIENLPLHVKNISLVQNQLSQGLEHFEQMNLKMLSIGDNNFEGEIPDFSNSPDIVMIYLDGNNFTGTPDFRGLDSLRQLYLQRNNFTGFPELDNPSLEIFYIGDNPITSMKPLDLPKLYDLKIHDMPLEGDLPEMNIPEIFQIEIFNTKFSGGLHNIKNLNARWIHLNHNEFSGNIPELNLPNVQRLYLNNNKLTGGMPKGNMPKLEILVLDSNKLSGEISKPAYQFKTLSIKGNRFSGKLPVFPALPVISYLDVSENLFLHSDLSESLSKIFVQMVVYSPQDTVPQIKAIKSGTTYNLSIDIPVGDAEQLITWYKNGSVFDETNTPEITTDDGLSEYYALITHSKFDELVISSEKIVPSESSVIETISGDRLIFPNPADDYIEIRGINELINSDYEIVSLEGEVLKKGIYEGRKINLAGIPAGIYFLRILNDEKIISGKFTITR
jgi:hypothetical protein